MLNLKGTEGHNFLKTPVIQKTKKEDLVDINSFIP